MAVLAVAATVGLLVVPDIARSMPGFLRWLAVHSRIARLHFSLLGLIKVGPNLVLFKNLNDSRFDFEFSRALIKLA